MRTLTLRQPVTAATLAAMLFVTALAALLLTSAAARAVDLPGDILWQKTTVASGTSGFVEMARGPKGVIYAVGARDYMTGGKAAECILLAKYSTSGRLLWKRSLAGGAIPYGSDGSGVAVDAAGNATVIGYKGTTTHGGDIVIARCSPAGKLLWTRTYNGPANDTDQAYDVALDRSGNALVAGYANTTTHGADILLLKLAARTGKRLWTYTYNNAAANLDEGANAVVLDRAGNSYLTGWSANAGNTDAAVPAIKVSTAGKALWVQRLQIGHWGDAVRIALDSTGAVVIGGDCIGPSDRDLFAVKLRPASGAQVWPAPAMLGSWAYTQNLNDMVLGGAHDDVYLVGRSQGPVPMGVIAVFKSNGAALWNTFYTPDHPFSGGSLAWTAAARGPHDDLFVAGCDSSDSTSTFEVGKAEWDGTWPLWQSRVPGSVPGRATPMDLLWAGGSTGGVYACGVLTKGGVDYAYIAKLKP